jgi:hypothetical protein
MMNIKTPDFPDFVKDPASNQCCGTSPVRDRITPRYHLDAQRKAELTNVIIQDASVGNRINLSWVKEYNEIVDRLNAPGCSE